MALERHNPDGMYRPPHDLYTQVIEATGGKQVHVAGTVARDESGEVVGETMAEQTRLTVENIETSLEEAGATREDVVRIAIYTLDCDDFLEEGYPIVTDFFEGALPTSALIGVDHLADDDYLMEIEATAVVEE